MGGGSWTDKSWTSYSSSAIKGKSTAHVYKKRAMVDDYNPKNVVMRESRDSEDHPNSTPIIIGLDVTGSMNSILDTVASKLGILVKEILDRKPVSDPQIMFQAIGDSWCDSAPLQVTQFESDIRIAEQLTSLYFEKGGGGNRYESYPLSWYFASRKTVCDNFEKRGKKGFIFTMGDDGYPSKLTKSELSEFLGVEETEDVDVKSLLNEVNRKYEVFHLCLERGSSDYSGIDKWRDLMGERAIRVTDYEKIPEIIVSILETLGGKDIDDVIGSWSGDTAVVVKEAIRGLSKVTSSETDLIEF